MPSFKDFEKIANLLEEQSRTLPDAQREVAIRRAISTIYYGTFWELRNRLRKRGFKLRESQPHSLILRIFEKFFPNAYPLIEELKKLRELADYQSDWTPDYKKLRRARNLAILILKEV